MHGAGSSDRLRSTRHQAQHDALTGLPNRALLRDRGERATPARVAKAERRPAPRRPRPLQGHQRHARPSRGDLLLPSVAARASRRVRDIDIARLGGDEFAVLCHADRGRRSRAGREELRAELGAPAVIDDLRIEIDGEHRHRGRRRQRGRRRTLLQQADVAMYARQGAPLGVGSTPPSRPPQLERLACSPTARARDDGLDGCYQPKLTSRAATDEVEVLLRWNHPRLGQVSPSEFVPLAEQTGLIRDLTTWVLETRSPARRLAEERHRSDGGGQRFGVDLNDAAFPRACATCSRAWRRTARLVLEITESDGDVRARVARRVLDEVTAPACGSRSTTSAPATRRSRSSSACPSTSSRSTSRSCSKCCAARTCARSCIDDRARPQPRPAGRGRRCRVEAQTLDALRAMGCDFAQGFFLSRPVPAPDLVSWLDAHAHPERHAPAA